MDDLVTLCLLGIFIVVGLLLLPRLFGGNRYAGRGPESPRYDDPDIDSRGGFGGNRGVDRPRYDDPNIRSRGGFGRVRSFVPRRNPVSGGTRRTDSPNISSRGGFGRSKD
ncbi:MAG: hypothetical protein L0154_14110 [Chloroflexi bacterium]|nr:hypothetical protein [Chloroflexota bacterium]